MFDSPHELVDLGDGHAAVGAVLEGQRDEAAVGVGGLGQDVLALSAHHFLPVDQGVGRLSGRGYLLEGGRDGG